MDNIFEYEMACDTLRRMKGMCIQKTYREKAKETPDSNIIQELDQEFDRYEQEYRALSPDQTERISQIRAKYDPILKQFLIDFNSNNK